MPSETGVYRMSDKTWHWINDNFTQEMSLARDRWIAGYNLEFRFNVFTPGSNPFDWFQSLVQRKAEELRESEDGQGLCQLEVDRMSCMIEDTRIAQENPGSFVPYPEMVEPEPVEFAYDNTYRRNEAGNLELVNRTPVHRDFLSEAAINQMYYVQTLSSAANYTLVNPFT